MLLRFQWQTETLCLESGLGPELNSISPLTSSKRRKYHNITFIIMTEYNNVINCSRTLRNILVIANKKSLELIVKRTKLTVKRTIENIWKSGKANAYIRALSKQKGI